MRNFKITDLMISIPSAKKEHEKKNGINLIHRDYFNLDFIDLELQDCVDNKTSKCDPCTSTSPDCPDLKTSACDPCTSTTPDCIDLKTSACDPCTSTTPDCIDNKTSACDPCTSTTPGKYESEFIQEHLITVPKLLMELKTTLAEMKRKEVANSTAN